MEAFRNTINQCLNKTRPSGIKTNGVENTWQQRAPGDAISELKVRCGICVYHFYLTCSLQQIAEIVYPNTYSLATDDINYSTMVTFMSMNVEI